MKKKILFSLALMSCLAVSAQKKWTLDDCISYAIENNLALRKARLTKKTVQENTKQSKAELFPSLSASTNHSVTYEPWVDSNLSDEKVSLDKTSYFGNYNITGKWTVWNGGKNINQLRSDRLTEQQAELDIQEQSNTIQEEIAKVYIQALYTNEAIKVNKESLEASKTNEERGQKMVEVGSMSKAELAQLTAQRATDEYNLVEIETKLAKYIVQLKQLLELQDDLEFDIAIPETPDEQALAPIPALQSVYEQALLVRPEIKNAELDLKQADLDIKIARSNYMPTVSLTGGISTSTSSPNSNKWGQQMKGNFDATAGVGITVPIFDNRLAKTAVNKARIQREQALLDQLDERETLYDTIEDYWLDAQTNQQKFRAAQVSVDSEQKSYDLLSEQFQLGLKNVVELLTGKVTLLKAQQNKLQSKYTTILSLKLLRFYQGEKMNL